MVPCELLPFLPSYPYCSTVYVCCRVNDSRAPLSLSHLSSPNVSGQGTSVLTMSLIFRVLLIS